MFKSFQVQLAFTGIASVGSGTTRHRTIEWLTEELNALPQDSQLQAICDALAKRSMAVTSPHGNRGVLEVILTCATIGERFRVAVISNIDWRKRPPLAKGKFTIRILTIKRPFHLISGYRDSVPELQQHCL